MNLFSSQINKNVLKQLTFKSKIDIKVSLVKNIYMYLKYNNFVPSILQKQLHIFVFNKSTLQLWYTKVVYLNWNNYFCVYCTLIVRK